MNDIQVLEVYGATEKVSLSQTGIGRPHGFDYTYVTHTMYIPAPIGISARSCAMTETLLLAVQENSSNPPDKAAMPAIWWIYQL